MILRSAAFALLLFAAPFALAAQGAPVLRPAQAPVPPAQPAAQAPVPPGAQPPASPNPPAAAPVQPPPAANLPPANPKSLADLQILLDRASFSPGAIDGKGGSNTKRALAAFQSAHALPVSAAVDAATWQNLVAAAGQQTLILYTIDAADVAGPFLPQIPHSLEDQAKLPALSYSSPLELLAEKFHCTPQFLQSLNRGVDFAAAGVTIRVPNVPPFTPWTRDQPLPDRGNLPADLRIVVSKSRSSLSVEHGDDVVYFAPVTSGSEHDPLPLGTWKVNGVSRAPVFHYNPKLFWDAKATDTKATVPAGPNNPVGVVWIDLSKEHYGIHGTPEPSLIGKTTSHGCVRMTNWDAQAVAAMVRPGTQVVFEP